VQGCYSTCTVSGNSKVGGIIGNLTASTVKNCAALNDKVSASKDYGRVAGSKSSTATLNGNVGFEWILDKDGEKLSDDVEPTGQHGAKKSAEDLQMIENFPEAFHNKPWTLA